MADDESTMSLLEKLQASVDRARAGRPSASKETPESLRARADRLEKKNRRAEYDEAVAAGKKTFGGHLGTCDALFGDPYCTCGKPSDL